MKTHLSIKFYEIRQVTKEIMTLLFLSTQQLKDSLSRVLRADIVQSC